MPPNDVDPIPSNPPLNDSPSEDPKPWIVSIAATILKFGVILLAIWAAWLALKVFSGFDDPQHIPVGTSVAAVADDPDSIIPEPELDRMQNIASLPVHHLLQGRWEMASAGWSIELHSLAGQSGKAVSAALLEIPDWTQTFPPSEELEQLLEVIEQFKPAVSREGDIEIRQLKTRGIQAALFSDVSSFDRIFLIRAVTQLTSDDPVLIEIVPNGLQRQTKPPQQSGSQESELFPDESFVITDQGKQHLSLIVAPMTRDELLEFWRKSGWQVVEMAPADGLPVMLRGVNESFQLEFINESPISTSFLATRIVQVRDDARDHIRPRLQWP